ncbi:hypothetical protein IL306_007284 [Fusarium sp. DS 682]|nr:hypothetical protein IL306_007284 [Fusarium sp. DS 682]
MAQLTWKPLGESDSGLFSIDRNSFQDYFQQNLENYIPNVCFQVNAHCRADGVLSCDMSVALALGGQATLSEVDGATVLNYSYTASDHDSAGELNAGSIDVGTTYNMDIELTSVEGNATVIITQHLVFSCKLKMNMTETSGNVVDKTIVDTYTITVNESGAFTAMMDIEPTDNSAPIDTDDPELNAGDCRGIIEGIHQAGDALASTNLQDIVVSLMQPSAFPGGQTLAFKSVSFSNDQDLVASATSLQTS